MLIKKNVRYIAYIHFKVELQWRPFMLMKIKSRYVEIYIKIMWKTD